MKKTKSGELEAKRTLNPICTIEQLADFVDHAPTQLAEIVLSKVSSDGKAEIDKSLAEFRSGTQNDWQLTSHKFIALVTIIEKLQPRKTPEERDAAVTVLLTNLQRERAAWPLFQLDLKRGLYRWIGPAVDSINDAVDI